MRTWLEDTPTLLLSSLLDHWQEAPSEALADVIDQINDHITEERGPVPGKNRNAREQAWRDIQYANEQADLGRLLNAIPTFSRATAEELLGALSFSSTRGVDQEV